MTYASAQQLEDQFGNRLLVDLSDRADPPAGAIDTDVLGRALTDADAVIDGYLASRYQLPLETVPPLVQSIASAIAIYKLHTFSPDTKIEEDHKHALRMLELIAKGTVRLPVAGLEPKGTGGSTARSTDRPRNLTQDNMKGFI